MGLLHHIKSFRRSEKGATIVEFAIVFPVMLAVFGAVVEGSRIYWNYQAAVSGVRDATRFLGRVTPEQICTGVNNNFVNVPSTYRVIEDGTLISYNTLVLNTVTSHLGEEGQDGTTLPLGISVPENEISVQFACVGAALRGEFTPVIKVDAEVQIELPFATLFGFFGVQSDTIVTSVVDQSRVFGL